MIDIRRMEGDDPLAFEVTVRDEDGVTRHHVTISDETYERLSSGAHTPERVVAAAFRFLLDREPKESILRRFDLAVIAHYFPDFARELPSYLRGDATEP
jgi:hypothetical protein